MNPVIEARVVIEKLGALVATPGISEDEIGRAHV